ncbi:MAG TPA: hypothetical protein VJW20_23550 [Candidatus Angelobacter sp.]|nr:hypothetical protein [Candidatus Angelobacter sp.]
MRDSRAQHNGDKPLPLFRPEAILNQQQKSYGDIILIRPLSLTLLTGLALAIVALAAAFLLLGHYTEMARVSGALLPEPSGATASNSAGLRAELYVPSRLLASVEPGARLQLHCGSCPQKLREQDVTVLKVSDSPVPADSSSVNTKVSEPSYKVTVSLPPEAAQSAAFNHPPQSGVPVEAEIPLGRKPLLKWLFKPSGS